MPAPHVMLRLLGEAEEVPLLFATVSLSGGHVSLQEMSDGLQSLDWSVLPLDYDHDAEMQAPKAHDVNGTGEQKIVAEDQEQVAKRDSEVAGRGASDLAASEEDKADTSRAPAISIRMGTSADLSQTEAVVEMTFGVANHRATEYTCEEASAV